MYEVFTTEYKTVFSLFTVCTRCLPRKTRRCSVCSQSVRGVYHGRTRRCLVCSQSVRGVYHGIQDDVSVCSQSVRGVYHGLQDGVQSVHSLYGLQDGVYSCTRFYHGIQGDVQSFHSLYEMFTIWTTRRCSVCSQSVRGVYHGIQDDVLSVHSLYEVFTTVEQDDVQSVHSLYEVFTTEDKTVFSLFTVCTRCLPRKTRRCLVCSQSVRGVYHGRQGDVQSVHSLYEVFTTEYKMSVHSLYEVFTTEDKTICSQSVVFTTDYKTVFSLFTVCTRCLPRKTRRCSSLFTVCTRCLPRTTRRCSVCSQSVRGVYHGIQDGVQSVHCMYEVFTTEDKMVFSMFTVCTRCVLFTVCTRCLPRKTRRCSVCSQSVRGVYHGRQDDVQSVHSLYEVFTTDYKTMFSLFTVCTMCLPRNTRRCSVCSQSVRGVYHGRQDDVQSVHSLYEVFTTDYKTMFSCSQSVQGVYHGVFSLFTVCTTVFTTEYKTVFSLFTVCTSCTTEDRTVFSLFTVCTRCLPRKTRRCSVCSQSVRGVYL